ncbi:MAG: hypothetical protein WB535_10045 [Paenarthrobacter sp.]
MSSNISWEITVRDRLADVVLEGLLILRFGFGFFQDLGEVLTVEIVRSG